MNKNNDQIEAILADYKRKIAFEFSKVAAGQINRYHEGAVSGIQGGQQDELLRILGAYHKGVLGSLLIAREEFK